MSQFRLIETIRVSEGGTVHLLDRHLKRLSRSAEFFSFKCDLKKIREAILQTVSALPNSVRLRLTLAEDGVASLEYDPLPLGYRQRLKLSRIRVNSKDIFLYHKTTNRGIYEQARQECDDETDAILINERGEITETPIMNIAVFRSGHWVTPRVSCGLLPGVMREELLERSEIFEDVILAGDLQAGETVRCFNALRGLFEIAF
jgi:branched-subunit amino acid aminotransferase/4-amino-4-deoxychorismate lyase